MFDSVTCTPYRDRTAPDQEDLMATLGRPPADVHELPEHDSGDGLTARQRRVLETIRDSVERRGYPPSMREIGEAAGLASPSSVSHQLAALERKGFLRRDPHRPRAIEVMAPDASAARVEVEVDETGSGDAPPAPPDLPGGGRNAAGGPHPGRG